MIVTQLFTPELQIRKNNNLHTKKVETKVHKSALCIVHQLFILHPAVHVHSVTNNFTLHYVYCSSIRNAPESLYDIIFSRLAL